jgi:hypothetical protein
MAINMASPLDQDVAGALNAQRILDCLWLAYHAKCCSLLVVPQEGGGEPQQPDHDYLRREGKQHDPQRASASC